MCLDDFCYEYKSLYVCRIFNDQWRSKPPIRGAWIDGVTSFGLPSEKNPNPRLKSNPQYKITIKRRATCFISVTQSGGTDMFTGKNPMRFIVMKNKGKPID